jgi:parallel beta-helix repeat protein
LEVLELRTLLSAYYVSPLGNDAAAGTAAAPWKTLQRAADAVHAGDMVTVRPGNYAGFTLGWNGPQNGTAAAPIVFNAQPGATIISRNSKTADGIDLEGASYVTIQGFTITNTGGTITRAGIRSVTNDHAVIRDNSVDGMGRWGIFTGFSDDVLIEDNIASHSQAEHGIYVSNSGDRPVIRGNVVFGNHNCGIHMNGDVSQGGDGIISGALVEDNLIYDNGVNGGSGINADGVRNSTFRNNVLYDNHASGISLFCEDGAGGSTGNNVTSNTIVMADDARWAINIVDGSTGNSVHNNILANRNTGRGAINIAADSLSGFSSDYNLVIGNRFTPDDGGTFMTLAQWRTATGRDAHSLVATEAGTFVDAAGNDYHLADDSAAIDGGDPAFSPAFDADGNARNANGGADMGAYEHTTPAPAAPSTILTMTPSRQIINRGESVQFDLSVTAMDNSVPSGTVTIFEGSVAIGAVRLDANGHATFSTTALPAGQRMIFAIYSGNAAYAPAGTGEIPLMVLAQ